MAAYVKFETPETLQKKVIEVVDLAKTGGGKVRIGVNEVTKAVERSKAKLVVMAEDVDPPEIMIHIPIICKEREIPYVYIKTKDELGKAASLRVPTSSVAITEEGKAKKVLEEVVKEVSKLK